MSTASDQFSYIISILECKKENNKKSLAALDAKQGMTTLVRKATQPSQETLTFNRIRYEKS